MRRVAIEASKAIISELGSCEKRSGLRVSEVVREHHLTCRCDLKWIDTDCCCSVFLPFSERCTRIPSLAISIEEANIITLTPLAPLPLLRPTLRLLSRRAHNTLHNVRPLSPSLRIRRRSQGLRSQLLLDGLVVVAALPELVDARVVDLVGPGLVDVDEEDDVVAQGGEAVQEGHLDGEGEEVVDEGVEELVRHRAAGHVRDGLEAVVDVQAGDLLGRG